MEFIEDFLENIFELFFWWTQKTDQFDADNRFEGRNYLEILFSFIVDGFRKKNSIEINRRKGGYFDNFLADSLILLLFFIIPMICMIAIQPVTANYSLDAHINEFVQIFSISLFLSFFWTGYVYLNDQFRMLINHKIYPSINTPNPEKPRFKKILSFFFNGGVEDNKHNTNFYFRSILLSFLFFTTIIATLQDRMFMMLYYYSDFHPFFLLVKLFSLIFSGIIIGFTLLIMFYLIISIFMMYIILFYAVRILPIGINPLIDRGGTEIFGNFLLNSLYLSSIAFGFIPLNLLLIDLNAKWPEISRMIHNPFSEIVNASRFVLSESVNNSSIDSISTYIPYIIAFLIFLVLVITIIFSLHYRIKQRKTDELERIESSLSAIDIKQLNGVSFTEDKKNLLILYEKIQTLHDWPTKNVSIIGIILSLLPLFISYTLSKL